MTARHDSVQADVLALLANGQSVSLVGPAGCGKRALVARLANQVDARTLVVLIDGEMLAEDDAAALFARGERALRQQAAEHGITLQAAAGTGGPARLAFEAVLRQLERQGLQVVLALIAIEHLAANPRVDVGLFNALRSVAGRLPLVLLTTSERPLIDLTYAGDADAIRSSPVFNIFAQVRVDTDSH